MAGLQYNFFPTDFLYPRPKPVVAMDANGSVINVVPLQTRKKEVAAADNININITEQPKSLALIKVSTLISLNLDDDHHIHGNRQSTT